MYTPLNLEKLRVDVEHRAQAARARLDALKSRVESELDRIGVPTGLPALRLDNLRKMAHAVTEQARTRLQRTSTSQAADAVEANAAEGGGASSAAERDATG
jgi:hypothetical protein